jgi:hypothetical protein
MAPPHVQSSKQAQNQSRFESLSKPIDFRSLNAARLSKTVYLQSSMPNMSGEDRTSIIEQFRLHREKVNYSTIDDVFDDEASRRRLFYIREQKLAAISVRTLTYHLTWHHATRR